VLIVAGVLVVLGAIVAIVGGSGGGRYSASVGDSVFIQESGLTSITVARDIATFDKLTDAAVAKDNVGYAEAAIAGGFSVSSGTSALVIDIGFGRTRVRVQSGPHTGEVGWVPSEWVVKQ
jgi:hypothetical protein